MSEEKKELLDQVSEKAAEAFDKAKEVGANVADKFKASSVGKAILGEDGKFDKDDLNRIKDGAVDAAKNAADAAKGAINKVKDMFGKDE